MRTIGQSFGARREPRQVEKSRDLTVVTHEHELPTRPRQVDGDPEQAGDRRAVDEGEGGEVDGEDAGGVLGGEEGEAKLLDPCEVELALEAEAGRVRLMAPREWAVMRTLVGGDVD